MFKYALEIAMKICLDRYDIKDLDFTAWTAQTNYKDLLKRTDLKLKEAIDCFNGGPTDFDNGRKPLVDVINLAVMALMQSQFGDGYPILENKKDDK
jgi:hypothetical protein